MKIFSCDIETTGLDAEKHQILEIGAVLDDDQNYGVPLESLPRFHTYVIHDQIVGDPYALSMHSVILRRIATREEPYTYMTPSKAILSLADFVFKHSSGAKPTPAGKNFGCFDLQFLNKIEGFDKLSSRIHRRIIDVGTLMWARGKDECLPSLDESMKRLGVTGGVAHTAVEDAMIVLKVLRLAAQRLN
jgi:oligoribonuclease (3'-5' exoribonuclease)